MSIVKMKKLRLIALRDQRDGLMRQLLRLGCVEVHEPEGMLSDPDVAGLLRPERAGLTAVRTRRTEMESALRVLARYAPEKKKLLAAKPMVAEADFMDDEALRADYALAEQINEWDGQLRRLAAEESNLRGTVEALRPWEALDLPLNGAGTRTCGVAMATAPADVDMESVADAAESVTEEVQIMLVSSDEQQRCFIAIALREELPAVTDALRSAGCAPVSFPGMTGTARENIDAMTDQITELEMQRQDLVSLIAQQKDRAPALRLSADRLAAAEAQAEAAERLRGTDSIVALEGWCPAPETARLENTLKNFDCAWEFTDPAPEEYPDVPVQLKNGRFVRPMNVVTEMYSLPAYDGVDPNPLMAPFFILFYGIMMADMAYGILMMVMSLVFLKKMRAKGTMGHLAALIGLSGISTFIFGALTGGFFGDFLPQLAKFINPNTTFTAMPALFTPLDDTIMILLGSLALGVVQIFTGMIVSVVYKCKNGDVLSAIFDEGAWWLILFGVAFMALGVGSVNGVPVVLCAGAALLVVGQFVMKKSLVGGITGLFGAIYNGVTGYFSDILSYSRLMALMLAGSVIATVFNTLGAAIGNVVVFVIIAMIGNALNFGLNLLGCFVHDLRLQVLEFFGRFYKDGGKPYQPLAVNTKYVDVIKEEI